MKFSFMSFSCPELNALDFFRIAKHYGYDGVEPRIDAGHKHGIELGAAEPFLRDVKKTAVDNEIKICCIATSCVFSNPKTLDENVEKARCAIALAGALEAPGIRVFGGKIPDGLEREKSLDAVVEGLKALAGDAAAQGVTVCFETHDDWCDPAWVVKALTRVDHPAVAVNWDIMHPVLSSGYTMEDAFQALKNRIRHVHVHDGVKTNGTLSFLPIGEGKVDHGTALRALRDIGYTGFISGEWINWEPCETHLPRELARMKSLL